ncbi:hypothetical protein [Paraburkholderia unamae]
MAIENVFQLTMAFGVLCVMFICDDEGVLTVTPPATTCAPVGLANSNGA